jgi:hypothetical protein
MRKGQTLPDMNFIRREIPIADVARELGIRVAGRNAAHCWRVGAHRNGDRTPSLSFYRNRVKCQVCDADSMSVIDLVIKHQEFAPGSSLREATDWICARWKVPTIAKNTKLSRPERWSTSPVGLSSFPLEQFVRSGIWAVLDDASRAILPVLFCFAEKSEVCVSYRALSRYSGKASDATIAKVLRRFKQIGILEALPKARNNFRDAGRYRFTLDSPKLQAMLSSVHERLRVERDEERELRAQLRATAPSRTKPTNPASYPGTTTLFTTVKCAQSARYTAVKCEESDTAPEKGPICEKPSIENKPIWETPRYTAVKCKVAIAEKTAHSTETARLGNELVGLVQ